jgi:hypothetical protein
LQEREDLKENDMVLTLRSDFESIIFGKAGGHLLERFQPKSNSCAMRTGLQIEKNVAGSVFTEVHIARADLASTLAKKNSMSNFYVSLHCCLFIGGVDFIM